MFRTTTCVEYFKAFIKTLVWLSFHLPGRVLKIMTNWLVPFSHNKRIANICRLYQTRNTARVLYLLRRCYTYVVSFLEASKIKFCYVLLLVSETATGSVPRKKVFWKILQNSQHNTLFRVSFFQRWFFLWVWQNF